MSMLPLSAATPQAPQPGTHAASWAALQDDFAHALLDPHCAVPDGLVGPDGNASTRRFGVYRNNVAASLIAALQDAYPVVTALVGEAFFRAMTLEHIRRHPPRTPAMFEYGTDFPGFLDTFPPVASLPWLADVARLERAWVEAYHAAEAVPMPAQAVQALPLDDAEHLPLRLHPSARLLRSRWPVHDVWRMHVGERPLGPLDLKAGGEDVLVLRPQAHVHTHRLAPGVASFIDALQGSAPLGAAAAHALAETTAFDVSAALTFLFQADACIAALPASAASGPDHTTDKGFDR